MRPQALRLVPKRRTTQLVQAISWQNLTLSGSPYFSTRSSLIPRLGLLTTISISWPTPLWSAGKEVRRKDVELSIIRKKLRIISAHAHGGLSKVIGSEAEELSGLGDFIGNKSSSWNFNHRSNKYFTFHPWRRKLSWPFREHLNLKFELARKTDENHNFGLTSTPVFLTRMAASRIA